MYRPTHGINYGAKVGPQLPLCGLLQKVYEVDPFKCPKCGGVISPSGRCRVEIIIVCAKAHVGMHVVAVIEDPVELRKVIEWAQTNQIHGPPVLSA